jgi:hypothetical protein
MKRPPLLAKWFLTHFAQTAPDSLLGDLQEEYEAGRSRWWYRRQVFNAIGAATVRQLRAHPVLALRAVTIGWAFLLIFLWYFMFPLANLDEELFVRGIVDVRPWWPKSPMVFLAVLSLGCTGSGWIVTRFHNREMGLLYLATVLGWNLAIFPRIAYAYVTDPSAEDFVGLTMVYFVLIPLSIAIGGVIGGATISRTGAVE